MQMILDSYQDLLKRTAIRLDRTGGKISKHQEAVKQVAPWQKPGDAQAVADALKGNIYISWLAAGYLMLFVNH